MTAQPEQTLINNLKAIRKQLDLTQEQFGQRFEPAVSKSAISRWERGAGEPNIAELKQIATLTGYDLDEIVREEKDMTSVIVIRAIPLADEDPGTYRLSLRADTADPNQLLDLMESAYTQIAKQMGLTKSEALSLIREDWHNELHSQE